MSSEQTNNPADHVVDPNQPADDVLKDAQDAGEAELVEESADVQSVDEGDEVTEALLQMQARIVELEQKLADAEQQAASHKEQGLRAQAEADNVRRRASQDVDKAHKFALEKFAGELLPVIDNLERALQAADREQDLLVPMIEGVELTLKSFLGTVEKFGVSEVNPEGEAFDPAKHQAMGMQESADVSPNTVIAVMQKGYELNGRLIRPAMVMISKAPA